jgi:tetratricopeptide (TPR) repeat protein
MLSELSDEAQAHAEQEEWGAYRNVRYDTAEYVRKEGQWKRAGLLYVEVMIFDLQGVTSAPGVDGFHETHQSTSPAVVKEIARFTLENGLGLDELKTVYDRVSEQCWMEAFPRSRDAIWEEVREKVWGERATLELDRTVEAAGADLLSADDAETFIERKNEYEIVRRVERILEPEHPAKIPREKQARAVKYLRAVDPESMGNRWKAKAYRRGGEVMLSQNGREKALDYFERALEAVDRDELAEVERMVKTLRDAIGADEGSG